MVNDKIDDTETSSEGKNTKQENVTLSPFYLHPSEGPGYLITTVQLKGENYEDWAKHVRNSLRTKRKLGFIDGTLKKPETEDEIEQWDVVNSMLVAWLMNTIEPTLRQSISMVEEVKVLWDDLKLQFSVGNGPRISELRADIANCRQEGDTVTVYYGKLKKLWDELAVYKPIRTCSCGELAALLEEDRNEEMTNTFLTGLDSVRFGTVRSTITSIEPLPKLSQVYQRIIREERQLSMTRNRETQSEAVGFSANTAFKGKNSLNTRMGQTNANNGGNRGYSNPNTNFREKDVTCTYCGKYGHAQADCFQLIGYPEWYEKGSERETGRELGDKSRGTSSRGRGTGRGGGMAGRFGRGRGTFGKAHSAYVEVPNQQNPVAYASVARKEYDRHSMPQLSDEQWTALLSFLSSKKAENNDKLNGPYFEDADWSG